MSCTVAAQAADDSMLPEAIIDPGGRPGHILVVDKAEQLLYLYSHDGEGKISLDRVMPCSTGENKGDKMVEGDKKTPNGYYILNQKLLPRELSSIYGTLAYPTNYPNFWDKKQGRSGYGIWIHGIDKPLVNYDSNGCIELENADIAKMEEILFLYDTPLLTYETLILRPQAELRQEAEEIKAFIESWRLAWVNKDHRAYQSKYAPEFVNSDGRSFSGWMAHKENVAKNYGTIAVAVKNLRIFRHRNVICAVFEQDYRGDQRFTSIGLKRLYLNKIDGAYKILGEEFLNSPDTTTSKWLTAAEKKKALETPPLTVAQLEAEAEEKRRAAEARAQAEEQAEAEAEARRKEEARINAENLAAQLKAEEDARATAEATAREEAEAVARAEAEAQAEKAALKESLVVLVKQWGEAWHQRDAEAFLAFYHDDFHYQAKNMDLDEFKQYRGGLIKAARTIEVGLSDFEVMLDDDDTARVIFTQNYRSDNLRDRGRKTLTMKKTDSGWKIVAETWKAAQAS